MTAVANHVTKYMDITVTSTGSGSTLTPETPAGTVNGVNTTFTVANEPVLLFTDGIQRISPTDYTYSLGTIEMNALIPPVQSIISYYNA